MGSNDKKSCNCNQENGRVYFDKGRRIITLTGYISEQVSDEFFIALNALRPNSGKIKTKQQPATVHINSGGGDIYDALKIYDIVKDFSASVTTIIGGYAHSGSALIFLAGDKRLIFPNATIGFHMVMLGVNVENPFEFQASADHQMELYKKLFNIFAQAVNISREELQKYFDVSRRIDAEKAVKIGLAHDIVKPPVKKVD